MKIGNTGWEIAFTMREIVGIIVVLASMGSISIIAYGGILIFWGLIDRKFPDNEEG